MSLFLLWFIWHELSPFPPPRVAYTTSREKTTWRDWLMNVTEYESLNLIFSSCFVAHLPLVSPPPFLIVMQHLLILEHKGEKSRGPIILLVKFSWALRPEKQYCSMSQWLEPWWEKRNWHLSELRGSGHQQNCFGGLMARFDARLSTGKPSPALQQRDATAVHCRDCGTFVKEPKVPVAPSRMAGNQTCPRRPQQQYSRELLPSNGLQDTFQRTTWVKEPEWDFFLKHMTHPWRAPGSQWGSSRRKKKLWASLTWMFILKWLYLYQQAGEAWDIHLTWSNLDYS